MERIEEPGKAPEVRIAELEKLTGRLRIGLILIGSLILYQGTWEIGLLGPVRVYASEVYASQFILEDEDQKVYGRWEVTEEEGPAQFVVFGDSRDYVRISSEGLEQREDRVVPEPGMIPLEK